MRSRGRGRWLFLFLLSVFRLGIFATVIELSMLDHLVGEIVELVTGEALADETGECDEQSCPPGCPSCHDHQGGFLSLPRSEPALTHLNVESAILSGACVRQVPPTRSIAPPERPPRA